MSALLTKIGQLAVFLICAQTLLHFRPKGSYEKYIKLLVSMMLLILLVEPVMDLLGKGERGDFLERVQVYEKQLGEIMVTPQLETEEIEVILQNITKQRVEEGTAYVQEQAAQGEVPVSGTGLTTATKQDAQENTGKIVVQVEIAEIQEVEIGAAYGKDEGVH